MRFSLLAIVSFILFSSAVSAANLAGTWRSDAPQPRALVIAQDKSGYHGLYYLLQDDPAGTPTSITSKKDGSVTFNLIPRYSVFDGKLSADGRTLSGSWTTFQGSTPLRFVRAAAGWKFDPAPHRALHVQVEKNVAVEVLDFGGSGKPLIFIPGSGNTAHVFDVFAPKFTAKHHVYAITRRGWGESDRPPATAENYDGDRVGDDVIAVLDALKIEKPVLVGHSLAGQELSSIGTRFPDRVAGLIYLDAAYGYAFYNPAMDSAATIEIDALRRDLAKFVNLEPSQLPTAIRQIRDSMARLDRHLDYYGEIARLRTDETNPKVFEQPMMQVVRAMELGFHRYTNIKPPFLAIYAAPEACAPNCDDPRRLWRVKWAAAQAEAVEKSYPGSRVVRIPMATHFVFRSNEAEVIREMNAFIEGLGQ